MKPKRWLKLAKGNVPIVCAAVSVVLLRWRQSLAQILLLRRTRPPAGVWCQVAGGIKANETAWQTALREVTEETGLRLAELLSGDFCEQFYEADKDRIMMLPVFIGVVPPDAEVVLNAEHDAHKWLGYEEADRLLAFLGQRRMLAAVKAEFIDRQPHALLRIPIA